MGGEVPKPLVRIGERSLIEINARRLLAAGIETLFVALHHEAAAIEAVLRAELGRAVDLRVLLEAQPLGTIGALAQLAPLGRTVVSTNADLVSALVLEQLLGAHRTHGADATIAVHEEFQRIDFGEVVAGADDVVVDYIEKPTKSYWLASGSFVFAPSVQALIKDGEALGAPDLVRRALAAGRRVRVHRHATPWIDVNRTSDIARAERIVAESPDAFPRVKP